MKPNPQQIKCSKDDFMKTKASNKNKGEKKQLEWNKVWSNLCFVVSCNWFLK